MKNLKEKHNPPITKVKEKKGAPTKEVEKLGVGSLANVNIAYGTVSKKPHGLSGNPLSAITSSALSNKAKSK